LIRIEIAPEVHASLRAMKDCGTPAPRCHKGVIESAIAGGVRRLLDKALSSGVRPWDLPDPQRRPETTRRVELRGSAPDSVLTALGLVNQCTEGGESILAEEVKNEIYDGATPYSTYVRGVIVDGDRGFLLTGRDDSALIIEG
jgi:hypothetical protein